MSMFNNYYETGELPLCPNCGIGDEWYDRVKMGMKSNPKDPTGQTPMPVPIHYAACDVCGYEIEI